MKNAIDDGSVVPGAGAFEIAVYASLMEYKRSVKGRARLGIQVSATFHFYNFTSPLLNDLLPKKPFRIIFKWQILPCLRIFILCKAQDQAPRT